MLMKYCPRCGKLITQMQAYCDTCQAIVDEAREQRKAEQRKKYNKKYNHTKRDPKYARFYASKEWKTLRAVKLSQSGYMCEKCKSNGIIKLAEDVHHIIPVSKDWEKRLDINNLRCLCVQCHNEEHERFKQGVHRKL